MVSPWTRKPVTKPGCLLPRSVKLVSEPPTPGVSMTRPMNLAEAAVPPAAERYTLYHRTVPEDGESSTTTSLSPSARTVPSTAAHAGVSPTSLPEVTEYQYF